MEAEMHRKQQQQQNKEAKNEHTHTKKTENKAIRTFKTCGPKDRLFIYHYH